jgi:hypothetical protein
MGCDGADPSLCDFAHLLRPMGKRHQATRGHKFTTNEKVLVVWWIGESGGVTP